jgi:two-component system chemotaxis response regulator CheY
MGEKIRLLVVDDSPFIHKAVKKALAGSDGIEIVGTAENGKICLDLVAHSIPTL